MRIRTNTALKITTLAAALAMAGTALAAGALDARPADVVRAEGGRPIADARAGGVAVTLGAALRARGRDAASFGSLRQSDSRVTRSGLQHVRFEQSAGGLVVYGAYAKGAFDRNGNLVHLIDHLTRVPVAGAIVPARIDAATALRTALARVHPDVTADLRLRSTSGATTVFEGGTFFDEAPSVTDVLVPMADGTLARGFVVETWAAKSNRLTHTLIGADGSVLRVQNRTNTDQYNVFREDPVHTPQTVVEGPGAGNAQSPAGWLSGPLEKEQRISGNNVNAYLDADANNRPDASGSGNRTKSFLTPANLAAQPTTDDNKSVSVTNLFYFNNVIHDILYSHGFTEEVGNFQVDNFAKGGAGNDSVRAEAQDGGGTNNANFATPPDGRKPRMQMYLWINAPTEEVVVTSPITARYPAIAAQFSPPLTPAGISGAIVLASPADGCTTVGTAVAGKIALVDRGTCNFTVKATNAQAAGATAMIVANNQGGTDIFVMGGTAPVFPAVMISQNSGAALKALVAPTGNVHRLPDDQQPIAIDASLDSDVVFHEYGHGLSWRMIGDMDGPISGAIGEGASDGVALLVNGDPVVGEYSASTASGIRRAPYNNYPFTYADVNGGEVHNDGEIYAAVVWRMVELFGTARRSTLFDYYVDGMNYTPSRPSYENMRDGILSSVAAGATPGDSCLVWRAFAKYGIGVGSSAVINADSTVTTSPSFAVPSGCPAP